MNCKQSNPAKNNTNLALLDSSPEVVRRGNRIRQPIDNVVQSKVSNVPSKSTRRKQRKKQMQQAIAQSNGGNSGNNGSDNDYISGNYVKALFEPMQFASRIPTRFPVKSALFRKRAIFDLDHNGTSDTFNILVRPWDLFEDGGTGLDQPAWFNYSNGDHTTSAWQYSYRHPMEGYFGAYGQENKRGVSYRVVATVVRVKYVGKLLDFSGMIAAGYLAGQGQNINTTDDILSFSQISQLSYGYTRPLKEHAVHTCTMLPTDPLDEVFIIPETSSDFEPPNCRNQIAICLSELTSDSAKFQVSVETLVEYMPSASFTAWTVTKPNKQAPQTGDVVRQLAIEQPKEMFADELKLGHTDSRSTLINMAKIGIQQGLNYGKNIPGTVGLVSTGLDAIYKGLIQ